MSMLHYCISQLHTITVYHNIPSNLHILVVPTWHWLVQGTNREFFTKVFSQGLRIANQSAQVETNFIWHMGWKWKGYFKWTWMNMGCSDKRPHSLLSIGSGQTWCQPRSAQRRFSVWGTLSMPKRKSKPPDGLRIKTGFKALLFMVSPISTFMMHDLFQFQAPQCFDRNIPQMFFRRTVTIQLPNHHHLRPISPNIKNNIRTHVHSN